MVLITYFLYDYSFLHDFFGTNKSVYFLKLNIGNCLFYLPKFYIC